LELQTQVLALGTVVTYAVLEDIGEVEVLFQSVANNSLQIQVEASFVDNAGVREEEPSNRVMSVGVVGVKVIGRISVLRQRTLMRRLALLLANTFLFQKENLACIWIGEPSMVFQGQY